MAKCVYRHVIWVMDCMLYGREGFNEGNRGRADRSGQSQG